jgi:hypothetical protein
MDDISSLGTTISTQDGTVAFFPRYSILRLVLAP